jgi:hypothetical protein
MGRIAVEMSNNKQEIIWVALMSVFVLACMYYFHDAPFLPHYLYDHEVIFKVFIYVFLAVVLITSKIFDSSTDGYDEYTRRTVKTSIINVVIWSIFWLCWCCFNLMVLFKYPLSLKLYLFSFLITNGPGALIFCFGMSMWFEYQEDWATIKSDLVAQGELKRLKKLIGLPIKALFMEFLLFHCFWLLVDCIIVFLNNGHRW